MNKYQKALDGAIERTTIMNNCCSFIGKCIKSGDCKFNDAKLMCDDYVCFKTLQELVEKATPKKAIKETGRWDLIFYKCPTCSKNLGWSYDSKAKYCDDCGQRIDWSK